MAYKSKYNDSPNLKVRSAFTAFTLHTFILVNRFHCYPYPGSLWYNAFMALSVCVNHRN